MNTRYRTATAALAATLVLTACGTNDDTATSDSGSGMHGGGHGATSAPPSPTDAAANEADIAFLTGMKPHHQQAVEMSDMVLAATPPAPVAELARQIKAAQDPEIDQMDKMLADLGEPTDSAAHMGDHGGMMSAADMSALMNAEGAEAARLYLTGMIEHHKGAIAAAETELEDGKHEPARRLASSIAKDQAAEIAKMEQLLQTL